MAESEKNVERNDRETENEDLDGTIKIKASKNNEQKVYTNSIGMEFVLIPAGSFLMGSDQYVTQNPVHKVTISSPFYIGRYPVTQKEWVQIMGNNPSCFKGDRLPVEQVSWNDAREFIMRLNARESTEHYRLPSEAEWEYACRAGTSTRYPFGDDESELDKYGWYRGTTSHEVGRKKQNPWGLYDMHGNVWEWCQDRWHTDMENAPRDGSAWEDGQSRLRVDRGGCWSSLGRYCQSALRSANDPDNRYGLTGFRIVREI